MSDPIGNSINAACRCLPDGWHIYIVLEKHSGWAELYRPDGTRVPDGECEIDSTDVDLAQSIHRCITYAEREARHE